MKKLESESGEGRGGCAPSQRPKHLSRTKPVVRYTSYGRTETRFKDRKVRKGWPREWHLQEVEKATDAIDKIARGRKAREAEYEGLRKKHGGGNG